MNHITRRTPADEPSRSNPAADSHPGHSNFHETGAPQEVQCSLPHHIDRTMVNRAMRQPADHDSCRDEARGQHFQALLQLHSRDLYGYAYWLCDDPRLAEGLVHKALRRASRALHNLNQDHATRSWLIKILRSERLRGFTRLRPKSPRASHDAPPLHPDGHDMTPQIRALRRATAALSHKYREPLILQVLGGYSVQGIAEIVGISVDEVEARILRARQKLRQVAAESS